LISRRAAFVLLAAAAWTLFIWVTRISNIVGDDERSTGFKVVHVVLALVSVAFAIAIAWIGLRALRTRRT
jgi:small neutral amino acid transporter SnatA (MarC family)